jgi:PiT family inorganic phosphate transporter
MVGGLIGAGLAHSGMGSIQGQGLTKIVLSLVISPLLGMLVAFCLMILLYWIFRRAAPVGVAPLFRRLQMLSAGFMALSHGSNDAQKTMGVITMSLVAAGYMVMPETGKLPVPLWVVVASATAMGLGTAAGGVRIIKTLGTKIIDLKPIHGFAAETAAATVIFTASHYGLPVSTTHCISGSILGVGASQSVSAVRWGITTRILWAWVVTIPISAISAYLMYWPASWLTGAN